MQSYPTALDFLNSHGFYVVDVSDAFFQDCALIPLLNAHFAVIFPAHHGWDVCFWQNMGYTRHRTQGTQDTGEHRTQKQAGRGQQGAPNLHSSAGRWSLVERQGLQLTFLLVCLLVFSFPGFGHFFL